MATSTHSRALDSLDDLDESRFSTGAHRWAAVARILLGFTFLWAFLDKSFGLGFATKSAAAWQFGAGDGSPTYGFLTFGSNPEGPFHGLFSDMASKNPNALPNWLFMLGLLGIGVALLFGVFMRIGAIGGAVLLFLMYLAEAPWAKFTDAEGATVASNNPLIDDHIVYGAVLILLMLLHAGRTWGFGRWWESMPFVKNMRWLA